MKPYDYFVGFNTPTEFEGSFQMVATPQQRFRGEMLLIDARCADILLEHVYVGASLQGFCSGGMVSVFPWLADMTTFPVVNAMEGTCTVLHPNGSAAPRLNMEVCEPGQSITMGVRRRNVITNDLLAQLHDEWSGNVAKWIIEMANAGIAAGTQTSEGAAQLAAIADGILDRRWARLTPGTTPTFDEHEIANLSPSMQRIARAVFHAKERGPQERRIGFPFQAVLFGYREPVDL